MAYSISLIGMSIAVFLAAGIGLYIDKKRREHLQKQH